MGKQLFLWFLCICIFPLYLSAQDAVLLKEIETSGNSPRFETDSYILSAKDPEKDRILFIFRGSLWSYDFNGDGWTRVMGVDSDSIDFQAVEMGYDTTRNSLLFWNKGVGRVYQWKSGTDSIKRIDNSFNHKTQFNHASFVHPENGDIYAFGGYGFWLLKNYITRYSHENREWEIVSVKPNSPLPDKRTKPLGRYWTKSNSFYIAGGNSYKTDRPDDLYKANVNLTDLWRFDVIKPNWKKLGSLSLEKINPLIQYLPPHPDNINHQSQTAFDHERGNWYIPIANFEGSPALLRINLKNSTAKIVKRFSGEREENQVPLAIHYDDINGQLLLFTFSSISSSNAYPVEVFSVSDDSLDATYANATDFWEKSRFWSSWGFAFGGFLLLLSIGFYFTKRSSSSNFSKNLNVIFPFFYRPTISIRPDGNDPQISIDGEDITNRFTKSELQLLRLLGRTHGESGSSFISNEKIENQLQNGDNTPDYLRKLRVNIIKNINRKFRKFDVIDNDVIIGRQSDQDRRKREYGINLDLNIETNTS